MALISAKGPGYVEMDLVYVKDGGKEEKYFAAVEAFTRLCFVRRLPDRKAVNLSSMYPYGALLWFFGWRSASQKTTRGLHQGSVSPRGARLWF